VLQKRCPAGVRVINGLADIGVQLRRWRTEHAEL
jgi:hypothetical protein